MCNAAPWPISRNDLCGLAETLNSYKGLKMRFDRIRSVLRASCVASPLAIAVLSVGCSGASQSGDDEVVATIEAPVVKGTYGTVYSPEADQVFWPGDTIHFHGACSGTILEKEYPSLPRWQIENAAGTPAFQQAVVPDQKDIEKARGIARQDMAVPTTIGYYTVTHICYSTEPADRPQIRIVSNGPKASIARIAPTTGTGGIIKDQSFTVTGSCAALPMPTGTVSPFRARWMWQSPDQGAFSAYGEGEVFSGVPTAAGQYTAKLDCLDSTGTVVASDQRKFTVSVPPPPPPVPPLTLDALISSAAPSEPLEQRAYFELVAECRGATSAPAGPKWQGRDLFFQWSYRRSAAEPWRVIGDGEKRLWKPDNTDEERNGTYEVQAECVSRNANGVADGVVRSVSRPLAVTWRGPGVGRRLWRRMFRSRHQPITRFAPPPYEEDGGIYDTIPGDPQK